jgi:hypothetical protein
MRWIPTLSSLLVALALTACDFIPPAGDDDDDDDGVPDEPVLANGDFEELDNAGSFFLHWNNYDDNPDGQILVAEQGCHEGQRCVHFAIEAEGDGWEYFMTQGQIDPAKLVPGTRYALTGLFKASSDVSEISFNYLLRGDGMEDIGNGWDDTHPSSVGGWEPFRFEFTIPEDASPSNYTLYLHLIKWNELDLDLWVDDVAFEEA